MATAAAGHGQQQQWQHLPNSSTFKGAPRWAPPDVERRCLDVVLRLIMLLLLLLLLQQIILSNSAPPELACELPCIR
jgi:hypothetical protein